MMKKTSNIGKETIIQKWINRVVVTTLIIVCSIAYIHKQEMMEDVDYTIGSLIKERRRPGSSIFKGKQVIIEYYVEGQRFESIDFAPSIPYKIGDCFRIEYSKENPQISEILWDEGVQTCNP